MKKTLLLIAVALFVSSAAFSQVKFGVGGAFMKGTNGGDFQFGAQAKGLYELSDNMNIGAGFTYFFDMKLWELNVDFQYELINNDDDFTLYGLVGAMYIKLDGWDGRTNIAVGAGATFGKFYAEVKYNFEMLAVEGGVGMYF